jgi:Kelch motif
MAAPRSGHTATLLPSGGVLMVGGALHGDAPATAKLFDPGSRQWTDTAGAAEDRFAFTATLLLDGRVLLAGDYQDNSRASAELYGG